ncbi:sulfurtransferase TusA family protein [Fictibacillus fluitans]|uniref:Sulfurtransferase TusA family protein n=1 Tax=Fictibacillus fluitans TaxID=3058422 RepID=A0ABT8HRE8_9BACL|nr:sulfurtransferase TusA family protein [Fictibacillus sp. NE201]MDN4523347.1 sulfurtransferase TusA family protein [Fictibacillus sp. NE201]
MAIAANEVLDCKGLACPMPIVKTKKAMEKLESGKVIEIQATDKGSTADIQSWAKSTGHQYLGTTSEGEVLRHYLRKANPDEVKEDTKFPHTVDNVMLEKVLEQENTVILDVREPAEYMFSHIPGSLSIPLGELENNIEKLDREKDIYVVCRTGNRSDRASQILADKGFTKIKNVVPGMSEWMGPVEKFQGGDK